MKSHLARILTLVTLLSFTVAACNGCKTSGGPPINWPAMVECGPSASDLIGVVTEVLYAGESFKESLSDLAREKGPDTVICVVEHLRQRWTDSAASMTTQRRDAIGNANEFLEWTKTEVRWEATGKDGSARGSGLRPAGRRQALAHSMQGIYW